MQDIWIPIEESRKDKEGHEAITILESLLADGHTPYSAFLDHVRSRGNVADVGAYSALSALHYLNSGEQVFALTPWQQQIFTLTDLPKGDVDIQYPYPGFFVALPERTEMLWGGTRTGWHRLCGAYVVQDPLTKGIAVVCVGRPTKNSRSVLDDAALYFHIAPKYFNDLEGWLKTLPTKPLHYAQEIDSANREAERKNRNHVMAEIARLVLNFLVYLTTPNPDVALSTWFNERRRYLKKRGKKGRRELDSLPTTPIRVVGSTIQRTATARLRETQDLTLHWVRGHYRRYRVGPGRTRVELRFVSPHLRGTVPGEDSPRIYEVK